MDFDPSPGSFAEYPRGAESLPKPARTTYVKDGRLARYVLISAGFSLLQHGLHALGIGLGHGDERFGAAMLSLLAIGRLVGGLGLAGSRRWALFELLAVATLYMVLIGPAAGQAGSPSLFLWVLFHLWIAIYCTMRLIGREGPKPR